jgi:hypothetical protein
MAPIFKGKKKAHIDPVEVANQQRAREQREVNQAFQKGITALRDFIAPSSIEFEGALFHLGTRYARTFYVYGYPRQLFTGWMSSMVNLDEVMDLSMYIYPVESQLVLENLRKKVTQLEAGIQIDNEKGRVRDPMKQAAIQDAEEMRDRLRFFARRAGIRITQDRSTTRPTIGIFQGGDVTAGTGPQQHSPAIHRPIANPP